MNYRNSCSCCGAHIDRTHMDFLIDNREADSEGNLCSQCYVEQHIRAITEMRETVDKVYNALKDPIKKFKFRYMPLAQQWRIIERLMNKGIITWKIG